MVDKKSLDFLPKVFQSNTNRRFLNATMDQLLQEPRLDRLYGYIGRQDLSPAYQQGDAYVNETDSYSQFYQLEPGLVINKRVFNTNNFKIDNAFNYVDLLNSITLEGGITNDHSRLFANEYYNYEGFVDLDKLINYGKYYWVPNGPTTLDVNSGGLPLVETFSVTRPTATDIISQTMINQSVGQVGYSIDKFPSTINPVITLVRGGNYTFNVGQPGHPFYIQTTPGLSSSANYQSNISTRDVYGVINNGAEAGNISFNVPKIDSQAFYENITRFETVDQVTNLSYSQLQGANYQTFTRTNSIDGNYQFLTKTIILNNEQDDQWADVPASKRKGIWQISNVEGIIRLSYIKDWPVNTKIFVNEGVEYGHLFIFKDTLNNINKVPNITAPLDVLYYQDGIDPNAYGEIRIIEQGVKGTIKIGDILGKKNYNSPNGVKFTNGLKIRFTDSVIPEDYLNNEYIVEGVGVGIQLVTYESLITPDPNNPNLGSGFDAPGEPYDSINYDLSLNAPLRKDYVVINRASVDGNAWSRTNRWFHEDVIRYAATFIDPKAAVVLDNTYRAIRPIVEFDRNLKLWDHGTKYIRSVTVIDTTVTDIANQVEGHSPYVLIDSNGNYYSDNVALEDGTYVIFVQERYENTKNKIYLVQNIKPYTDQTRNKTTTVFAAINNTAMYLNTVTDLLINMSVTGTNVPPNTVIKSIDSTNNTITFNNKLSNDVPVGTVITFRSNIAQVHLTPVHTMSEGDSVVAISGVSRQNVSYWWHNDTWKIAQQKFSLNQNPLFEVFDLNGNSFGDQTYYPSTDFAGSKLFGYLVNENGTRDSELGFALSYKSIGNVGDILLQNFYDTDTFNYSLNNIDQIVEVNSGFAREIIPSDFSYRLRNNWSKIAEPSKQFIQRKVIATKYKFNNFNFDIAYLNSFNEKNIFVYINGKKLVNNVDFILVGNSTESQIQLTNDLADGDVLVVKIYGKSLGRKENFTMPKNLVDNSENNIFTSLTLGQIRNHLLEMTNNSLDYSMNEYGNNNLRDINYKVIPGKILQHSSGAHIAQLMFNNDSTNIIKSLNFNRQSYNRFKDRFFYLLKTLEFEDPTDSRNNLDIIMEEIVANASSNQAFYYTDMIPYGINKYIRNDYPVYDTNYRLFNLINTFDVINPTYQAVLVYLNDEQLLIGSDYTDDGSVITLSSNLTIAINDIVSIYEYASTKGCMIPATPTKLGLYPKYTPEIYLDDTYIGNAINVIQGHDGSKIIAFNDYRDNIVLEFEKRIYNNIAVEYTNDIQTSFSKTEPGAFRNTDYSIEEWTQLLSSTYLNWAGNNNINVFTNNITQQNDAFSFNYSAGFDRLYNEPVPGYWRGIYKYFFDTDSPHLRPWEMLGFSQRPTWWVARYGPAPYTAGNLVLWKDLELGLVYQHGLDSYIDVRYARPGLTKIIPADEHGELLPPISSIVINWKEQTAGADWKFGDQSPQETAWRRSSDYPFAIQIAWALSRPAEYCALSINRRDIIRFDSLDQVINKKTGKRSFNLLVSGETQYIPGSNIWIRDRLADTGLNVTTNFEEIFNNYKLNLVYKTSSFTDKEYLQVTASQSSPNSTNSGILIPQENYNIVLTKSAPIAIATYSAIIIQKGSYGFKVYGFDNQRPYFTIIPRNYNNNSYNIKVSNSTALVYQDDQQKINVVPYGTTLTSIQQVVDFIISYGKYLSAQGFEFSDESGNSITDWILPVKEFLYWLEQGWDNGTVLSLTPTGSDIKFSTDYGVVDDITNGFTDARIINSDGRTIQSTDYATFRTGTAFELSLKDGSKGVHLIDMFVVLYEHTLVFDNVTVFNDVIYEPSLGNRQYRMKISGFKTRDWDGSLYAPGFLVNHRPVDQWMPITDYRKGEVIIYKNQYHTARQFIPGANKFDQKDWYQIDGSLLNKTLIPNMAFNAQQFEGFYDVDKFDVNASADMSARNSTGFVPRQYLTDIGLDTISQHKFYLGMIREKGTQAAVNAFLRAKLPYLNNDIQIDDQWAIRLGNYGGSSQKSDIELSLANANQLNGAYVIELVNRDDAKSNLWNSYRPQDLLIKPTSYDPNIFTATESNPEKIGMTGPVLISEVDTTVFDIVKIPNISAFATILGDGSRIWVGADPENSWNVYRLTRDDSRLLVLSATIINKEIEFTTNVAHNFTNQDIIMIKNGVVNNSRISLAGFYRINSVSQTKFRTPLYTNMTAISGNLNQPTGALIFKLKSVKYKADTTANLSAKGAFALDYPGKLNFSRQVTNHPNWNEGDKVWIVDDNGNHEVLTNSYKWNVSESLTPKFISQTDSFGISIDIKSSQDIMVVGAPVYDTQGSVYVYRQNNDATWSVIDNIIPEDTHGSNFGYCVKYNNLDLAAIGAPDSNSGCGLAYIASTNSTELRLKQAIYVDGISSSANFGKAVAASRDGNWLAVGAPGTNRVYIYKRHEVETEISTYVAQSQTEFLIPFSAQGLSLTANDVQVRVNGQLLVPFLDYTLGDVYILAVLTHDVVTLLSTPGATDIVEITYETWYQYLTDFTSSDAAGSFGYSMSFTDDGSQLLIGAPTLTYNTSTQDGLIITNYSYLNMGAAYVYERTIESFRSTGLLNETFSLENTPAMPRVYVDGTENFDYTIATTTLSFADLLDAGSIVTVETNNFRLIEKKVPTLPNVIGQNNLSFGSCVVICPTTCSLYIGAPGYNNHTVQNGAVFRYVNTGKLYGSVTVNNTNPLLNYGSSIRLNGFKVTFTGYTTAKAALDINLANIPGVRATSNYNTLTILSNSLIAYNMLSVNSTNSANTLSDLGFEVFKQYQLMSTNNSQTVTNYGSTVYVNNTGDKLVIGSNIATSQTSNTFDNNLTSFDSGTTNFFNGKYRAGAAYLYEYQSSTVDTINSHGNFAFTQLLTVDAAQLNDKFGTSVAMGDNWLMITALNSSSNAGTVYSYYNSTGESNWTMTRTNSSPVDTRKIERIFLYNNNTKTLISDLAVIDPEHGLPTANAIEQIKYIVSYDPATYTSVPNTYSFSVSQTKAWGEEHVGELWWDTSGIRYVDWNQGSVIDRLNNWGLSFPSSFVSVYEWTESDLTPSQYAKLNPAAGPTYTISDVYTIKTVIDPVTLHSSTKYYFWTRNNNSDNRTRKGLSALQIQNLIANPRNSNEPFAAVIGANTFALFNCQNIINDDTCLHISLTENRYVNPVHNEWSMFDDGTEYGVATEFLDRVNDSLSGQDSNGRPVPDPVLTTKERYGLSVIPRQTTFADNMAGRKVWVNNVNAILKNYPITILRDITLLAASDPIPEINGTTLNVKVATYEELSYYDVNFYEIGERVIIENDSVTGGWTIRQLAVDPADSTNLIWEIVVTQSYDLKTYWSYVDWYASGYSASTVITKTVDYSYEIANSKLNVNDVVKVKYGSQGLWNLVLIKENSLELIGQESATIQFNSSLYNNVNAGIGIDTQSFESNGFAKDSSVEFRKMFEVINQHILNNELRSEFKKVISALIDNIATQFIQTDWLLKTSLINIKHRVRTLDPIPVYVKQPEGIVTEFINEVKPYHTKIKQYLSTYDKTDLSALDMVDFDLPAYYNNISNSYRQPQLGNDIDSDALSSNIYAAWLDNYKYSVESIDIFDGGQNYSYTSNITVKITGDGTGATADAFIRNGKVIDVIVTNPGSGYTYAIVQVISNIGTGARLYARLGNNTVRDISTTIKFDRFTYAPITIDWAPNTNYTLGSLINYNHIVYRPIANFTSGTTFSFDNVIELRVKVWEPNRQYSKDDIIVYHRVPYISLTDFVSDRYFNYNTNISVTHSVSWGANTSYTANSIISYNGNAYRVTANFTSSNAFSTSNLAVIYNIAVYPGGYFDDAASRVWSYYEPNAGMPGRDLTQVMSGLEYGGVKVTGQTYDQKMGFGFGLYDQIPYDSRTFDENGLLEVYGNQKLDNALYSLYNDTQLGVRPEDMITDGAGYLDSYNSYGPEEFIPGYMFDSLDIRVKTLTSYSSAAPEIKIVAAYADDVTIRFSFNQLKTNTSLPIGGVEGISVFNDFTGPKIADVDYIVNWSEKYIEFFDPPPIPSTVYINLTGASGIRNTVNVEFIGNGLQTNFEVVDFKLTDQQFYVKTNGVRNDNWSLVGEDSKIIIGFEIAPLEGDIIQIHMYNLSSETGKAYSEILNQRYTVESNYVPSPSGYVINLPEKILYAQPWEPLMEVLIDGILLEPSNQAYYESDGIVKTYSLPLIRNVTDVNLITDSDIIVVVDGETRSNYVDYTIVRNGVDIPTVNFVDTPVTGSMITVSNKSEAAYTIYENQTLIIDPSVNLIAGANIDVTVYGVTDQYDIRTEIFSGEVTVVSTDYVGFDVVGFDSQTFDTEKSNFVTPVYTLSRPVTNMNNVKITLNGIQLSPYYDFVLVTPTTLRIDPQYNISAADIIIVKHVSEVHLRNDIEYRIFKGIAETYNYLGISKNTTTRLTRELMITDKWIYVENINVLSQPDPVHAVPGVVFINGERITFGVLDSVNSRLGQLNRATNGTGAADRYPINTDVYDGGFQVEIPESRDSYIPTTVNTTLIGKKGDSVIIPLGGLIRQGKIWYNIGTSTVTDGMGIENANTVQANFLKAL
jgi:hypothetical protein